MRMTPTRYIRAVDGALVDGDEALDAAGILKPGYGFKLSLAMRDHAVTDAVTDRAQARGISASQAAYELRIADAWRNG
jgi:hypothetical protein